MDPVQKLCHLVGVTLGSIEDKQEPVTELLIALIRQSDNFEK